MLRNGSAIGGACTGQCCVAFPLNVERERLPDDLRDMLVPVSTEEATERHKRLYPDQEFVLTGGYSDGQYYRCRHWDEGSRLCRTYEVRPLMCRDYPGYSDGKPCEYGCGCTDMREGVSEE